MELQEKLEYIKLQEQLWGEYFNKLIFDLAKYDG